MNEPKKPIAGSKEEKHGITARETAERMIRGMQKAKPGEGELTESGLEALKKDIHDAAAWMDQQLEPNQTSGSVKDSAVSSNQQHADKRAEEFVDTPNRAGVSTRGGGQATVEWEEQ